MVGSQGGGAEGVETEGGGRGPAGRLGRPRRVSFPNLSGFDAQGSAAGAVDRRGLVAVRGGGERPSWPLRASRRVSSRTRPFPTHRGSWAEAFGRRGSTHSRGGGGGRRPLLAAKGVTQGSTPEPVRFRHAGGLRPEPSAAEGLLADRGGGGTRSRQSWAQGEVGGRELVVDAASLGLIVRGAGGGSSSEVGLPAVRWRGLRRACAGGVGREVDGEDGKLARGVGAGGQSCWWRRRM